MIWRFIAAGVCLIGVSMARGDEPKEQVGGPARSRIRRIGTGITRADLAIAFLRFEEALAAHPPAGNELPRVHQAFDALTMSFFSGNMGEAISALNRLTASLSGGVTPTRAVLESLRVRMEPPVFVAGSASAVTAKIQPMYAVPNAPTTAIEAMLALRDSQGNEVAKAPVLISPANKQEQSLSLRAPGIQPGRYQVVLSAANVVPLSVATWSVVREPLAGVRARNEERLTRLVEAHPELAQSLAACRARNKLLSDTPSTSLTREILADHPRLVAEIDQEISALSAGKDPYAERAGDYWRVFRLGSIEVPMRVFAPEGMIGKKSVPLVIAFHGAGGDENMFMDAYGLGKIKRLARERGFLLVTPTTGLFVNGNYLDQLLEVLTAEYPVDPARIYVIGHSMGAGVAEMMARARPARLAAVCCLAGGRGVPDHGPLPPMLVIGAELDPLIPPQRLEQAVKNARSAGLAVEYRAAIGQGHTLMVPVQLDGAIDWLLSHRLDQHSTTKEPAKP